jgi:glycosyltransferase involved in cell wall biosynthesis
MNVRRRSVAEAAYAPSAEDGLPNGVSAIVQWSRMFGAPSSTQEHFWAVATWWMKFGAAEHGGSVQRFLASIPTERFVRDRFCVPLPSGKTLSLPVALSLINPPDQGDAAARAAHTIMYAVIDYDLFDLCFRDTLLVTDTILDFDAFLEWLKDQPQKPGLIRLLARYVAELIIRRPAGIDAIGAAYSFSAWIDARAAQIGVESAVAAKRCVSEAHRTAAAPAPASVATVETGSDIDVYGYFAFPIGLGEDARLTATALEMACYRVNRIGIDDGGALQPPTAPIGFWAVPAPNLAARALRFTAAHDRQFKIIASPWELPRTPGAVAWVYRGMDLVCVYSAFVESSLPADLRPSAIRIPMAFDVAALEAVASKVEKAPVFTFVAMFDFASGVQRKGPHRAIAAFKAAFDEGAPVRLLVKSTNGDRRPEEAARLRELVGGERRIALIDAKWESDAVRRCLAEAHAFVSLHASEGFGRVLAESMLLNTQVIATDYSGSQEVCSPDTALVVPYTIVPVGAGDYYFGEGQHWAQPDIGAAAAAMRDVFANWNSERLSAMRKRGRKHVRDQFSLERSAAALRRVIERAQHLSP